MRRLTFRSRVAILFSLILAVSLIGSGVVFSLAYYSLNLVNIEKFLIRESSEVFQKHLIIDNQEIFFRKDSLGKTLSAYLRDEGLSSLVLDRSGNIIGSYGVYRGRLDANQGTTFVEPDQLDAVRGSNKPTFNLKKLYENRTYLEIIYPLLSNQEIGGYLILSTDVNMGNQMMVLSLSLLALILPVSLILGWLLTRWMVGKSFKPLEDILSHMSKVGVGNLSKRIKIRGNPKDEIVRLSESFNKMLERIEEGVEKQKEFVSNASHELKTPLARSILSLEVIEEDLKNKNIKKSLSSINQIKKELIGFGDLIHSLLTLANIQKSTITPTNIVSHTKKIIKELQEESTKNKSQISFNSETKKRFLIQKDHWKVVVTNLLVNALKHGHRNSKIIVRTGEVNHKGYLQVENLAEKIERGSLNKMVRRFYRSEKSKGSGGQGIGLAVVRDIVSHYKLEINIQSRHDQIFLVSIEGFDLVN